MAPELEKKIKEAREVLKRQLVGLHVYSLEETIGAMMKLSDIMLDMAAEIRDLNESHDSLEAKIRMAYARAQKKEPEPVAQSPQ